MWSDYDGDEIYGEFTVRPPQNPPSFPWPPPVPPEPKQERSYVMGMATVGWKDDMYGGRMGDSQTLRYYHKDMIGTTRFMTNLVGDPSEEAVFTGFGQRVERSPRRFGYAGEWGYQSTLDDGTPPAEVFPFLHVGARYYDPATGRFLQRDPIGIDGGSNVYLYVGASPLLYVDPDGLDFWGGVGGTFLWITGGNTWLGRGIDAWGGRLRGRTLGTNAGISSGVGSAVNSRRGKRSPLPGQKPGTNRLASALTRRGLGRAANVVRRTAPAAAAVGGLVDVYILAKEGIYAACGVPPGMY